MTLQQMTVFLAVCEERNFSKTARKLFMSRQAVRQNITQLEREYGGLLFENHKNHLELTHKGKILMQLTQPVVEKYRELQRVMVGDLHQDHPLRIGVSVSLVPDYLPDLLGSLQTFKQRYSDLAMETVIWAGYMPESAERCLLHILPLYWSITVILSSPAKRSV